MSAVHTAVQRLPVFAGKPETPIYEAAFARFGTRKALMVGDRLDTDIKGAVAAGIPSLQVLTGVDRLVIRAAKRFGFIDRITPAGRTVGRREAFGDVREARDYFAGKTLFSRFDPECLDAYVRHGLREEGQGQERRLRLRFDPATEISIYRSVPHTVPGRPQQLAVPLAVVRGRHSKVVLPHHARQVSRVPKGEYLSLPGGHMFPLERPQDTAHLLRELFGRWQGQGKEHSA